VDNTDVALIVGYGVGSRIERNVVQQRTQSVFAGLMLHNFNSNDLSSGGDFRGAVIAHNTVDCGPQLCVFGIQVGSTATATETGAATPADASGHTSTSRDVS